MINHRPFLYALSLIIITALVGTGGYVLLEGWSWQDALFMTIITVSTVGYGETAPLSDAGRLFTMLLIVASIGVLGYSLSTVATFIMEGEFRRFLQGRQMDKQISGLRDHYIICGGGRTGKHIVNAFLGGRFPFVLIEQDSLVIEDLFQLGSLLVLQGDATRDEVLQQAGIERARGLFAAMGDDKENVFVVLTARSLNPKLHIVARFSDEQNAEKLRKAGANDIVSPNAIGGLRMASLMLRPSLVTFVDELVNGSGQNLDIVEIQVDRVPALANKTLGEVGIGSRTGALVVALKTRAGTYHFNPGARTTLVEGSSLVVFGTPEQVRAIEQSD